MGSGTGSGAATAGSSVVWTDPDGWKSVQSDQPMRLATFDAGGAEVTVTAFPGAVGGNLANVNRWRGQIGLEPVEEGALAELLTTTREGATSVSILAMTGRDGKVLLGAIIVPGDGQTWFAKTITDADRANALREAFASFAQSFRMKNAVAAPPVDVESRLAAYAPPANWKAEGSAGGIVAAAFSATNAAGGARVTATSLANDGGGDLANINRWRGQLGLAPLADPAAIERAEVVPGMLAVDLRNADGSDRMIAVIAPAAGATWFYKLRGSVGGVEAERAAFAAFVRDMAQGGRP